MGAVLDFVQKAVGPRAIPPTNAAMTGMVYSGKHAQKLNVEVFRNWGKHSPWVRAAINLRKSQIAAADYEVGPFDINRPHSKRLARDIKAIFDHPNDKDRSFRAFISPVIDDILTLDAGSIEAVTNMLGELKEIWSVDGGKVRVSTTWEGDNPREPRYFWYPDGQNHGSWRNDEFAYMMMNPVTYGVLGISPLETLKMTIDAELNATDYNRRQVSSAPPEGLLNLGEGIPPEKAEQWKSFWLAEIAGKGAMGIIAGTKSPSWIPFRQTNRDMGFKEWQEYLVRQIAAVMGMAPQDLGLTFDINRSQGDVVQELSEDRGLRPLADMIEDELTHQFVWHPSFGGPDNNLAFRFTRLNIRESQSKANINKIALAGVPWKTGNEARVDEGREPIGDLNAEDNPFNQILANTPLGMVRLTENSADIPTARELSLGNQTPASGSDQPPSAPAPKPSKGPPKEP
jgi:phage portal protein BeeE